MPVAVAPVPKRALLRAFAWALIGAIYAPLFVTLNALVEPSLGAASWIAAAATAGAVGAAFYGARQVALIAALVGVAAAAAILMLPDDRGAAWMVAVLAVVAGFGIGLVVRFPDQCLLRVLAKVLSGGLTGALCGALLVGAGALAGLVISMPVVVAFLVSVNGVLYVSALPWIISLTPPADARWQNLTEAVIVAAIALVVAGSLWGFAGMLADDVTDPLVVALNASAAAIPAAAMAGVLAGAITGALLELFDFAWTEDL